MKLIALFFARLSVLLTKWTAIGVLWLASVFLVTSSALLMDQFSDWARMLGSYTTPYAKQKAKARAASKRAATANKKVKAANKRVADASHRASKAEGRVKEQKRLAKAHSAKVKKIGGKMVARNAADATTSMIPVIGGAASVTFAVWDVYAACELITEQKRFELLMGTATADEYTLLEGSCVSTTAAVEATGKEAEDAVDKMKNVATTLPDIVADGMCRVTGKCSDHAAGRTRNDYRQTAQQLHMCIDAPCPELPYKVADIPDVQIRVPDVTDELANMMCKVTHTC